MNNTSLFAVWKRWYVPASCLASILAVASGCREKPRRPSYEIVDNPKEKPKGKSPAAQTSKRSGAPQRASARPETAQNRELTAAPKLQVLAQGTEPRSLFTGHLPTGLQAVYHVNVSQVTAAPEPIGSFESSFDFQLTETVLKRHGKDDKSGKVPQRQASSQGRGAVQAHGPKTTDAAIMGSPLRVTLSQVKVTLPRRFHMDGSLLARQLEGVAYLASLLPDGSLTNLHVEGPLPKDLTTNLEQLGRSLNRLQPPLPRVALGVGAKWRVTSLFKAAGHLSLPHTDIQVTMITDYHLDSFEQTHQGRVARISTTVSVQGKNQSATVPIAATGRGKGTIRVLVTPTLVLGHHSQTTVESRVQGKKSSNTTLMKLTLQSLKMPRTNSPRTGQGGHSR